MVFLPFRMNKGILFLAALTLFTSETDFLQDAAFEIVASCGRSYWAADQHINLEEETDFSRYFDRADLICPEAATKGSVEIMDCWRDAEGYVTNEGMWQRRQYASVVLLVPNVYGSLVP